MVFAAVLWKLGYASQSAEYKIRIKNSYRRILGRDLSAKEQRDQPTDFGVKYTTYSEKTELYNCDEENLPDWVRVKSTFVE